MYTLIRITDLIESAKPAAPTTQSTYATEPESNVAQLATAQATKQESNVAQLASQVLVCNASMLAFMANSEAVLCACRGLDSEYARRHWVYVAHLVAIDFQEGGLLSCPPGYTATYLKPLQDFLALLNWSSAKLHETRVELAPYDTCDWRANRARHQEHIKILYPSARRLLLSVVKDDY